MLKMARATQKNSRVLPIIVLFVIFSGWFAFLHFAHQDNAHHQLDWFAATYGSIALVGGISGLFISKQWGGFKSVIGKAMLFFSLGLLMQEFGQLVYAYYAIVKVVEIPYPSLGDIGFFGSVIFYIAAAWQLAGATGIRFSLKDTSKKVIAMVIPLVLLISCYLFFLKGYEFESAHPLTVFLDFGYPLGQAVYLIIALMTYLFSQKLLGGVMKNKILLILAALLTQYAADFNFLFQANRGTWTTAGYGDFLYLFAYTCMALGLMSFTLSIAKSTEEAAT